MTVLPRRYDVYCEHGVPDFLSKRYLLPLCDRHMTDTRHQLQEEAHSYPPSGSNYAALVIIAHLERRKFNGRRLPLLFLTAQ